MPTRVDHLQVRISNGERDLPRRYCHCVELEKKRLARTSLAQPVTPASAPLGAGAAASGQRPKAPDVELIGDALLCWGEKLYFYRSRVTKECIKAQSIRPTAHRFAQRRIESPALASTFFI